LDVDSDLVSGHKVWVIQIGLVWSGLIIITEQKVEGPAGTDCPYMYQGPQDL